MLVSEQFTNNQLGTIGSTRVERTDQDWVFVAGNRGYVANRIGFH